MDSGPQTNCVVIGAGALGLGFLGPELTPDCRVTYLDIPAKAELLAHLDRAGSYVFNETGLSMRAVEVRGVGGRCLSEGGPSPEVDDALDAADLVFTAVGEPNLPNPRPPRRAERFEHGEDGCRRRVVPPAGDVPVAALDAELGRMHEQLIGGRGPGVGHADASIMAAMPRSGMGAQFGRWSRS